jgi:hypothetical protein
VIVDWLPRHKRIVEIENWPPAATSTTTRSSTSRFPKRTMSLEPAFVGIDPPRSGLRVDHLPAIVADSCAFQGADLLGSSWALTSRAQQSNNKDNDSSNGVQLSLLATTATQVALLHGRRRAQLKSWTVRAGASTELTHVAVAFPGTDVLLAVQSNSRLVAWNLADDNISQGSKATVSGFVILVIATHLEIGYIHNSHTWHQGTRMPLLIIQFYYFRCLK